MIASNIICRGASRFLNTAYFQDVQISGTATLSSLSLSGNLSVTGTSTLTGHVSIGGYNNTSYGLSTNSAIVNDWIRTVGQTGWYNETYAGGWYMTDANYIRSYNKPVLMGHNMYFGTAGDTGYYVKTTGAAKFASVVAPTGSIATLNSDNVSVSNNLHAAHFDLQTVAQLGGSFYVSPTVKFPNSGTTLVVAKSGITLTLTITDSSITSTTMAGIVWSANSRVKVSGTINGVVTGTMDGSVSSINTGSHTLTLSVSGENSGSVVAGTYSASQFSDLSVMVYQRKQDGNDYRVGIWMNCYDLVNSSSTIRVYGGTSSTPNVTIGNLTGSTFNGETISGNNNWGILTTMGYFEGAIISTEGQIGGWTIGDTKLYHNTNSITSTDAGLYLGTDGIRNYSSGTQYVNITSGKITALGVDVSGKITATSGAIGGFDITSTAIKTKDVAVTSNADNSISLSSADFTRTINSTSRAGLRFAIGDKFGVTGDGAIYASSATISGAITATSLTLGTGVTIAQSQVDGLTTALNGKASTSSVTDAAKTATNFITADGTNGIKIHKTSNTTDYSQITTDYVQIISDGTHIYKGSNDVACFGDTARIGRIANGIVRTQIDSDSFDVIKRASNTDTVLATFGETATIGNMSARGVSIDTNGFKFNNGGEQNFFIGVNNRSGDTITSATATVTKSSTTKTIDDIVYYRVASIASGQTVISVVGHFVSATENGEELMFAAVEDNVKSWVVDSGYLWVEDGYSDYSTFEETITYSYTTSGTSNLPYMVLGTSAYNDDNIPGVMSFAQGYKNKATGSFSTAIGSSTVASGKGAFACGMGNTASGPGTFVCGNSTVASGYYSHAEGASTKSSGFSSHAEGLNTISSANYSHAEGYKTTSSGFASHTEGNKSVSQGNYSHAEGDQTTTSGNCSHAEGGSTIASGQCSHAEGTSTKASGYGSHAEGGQTTASGSWSHAEGGQTTASGQYSHTAGLRTIALHNNQFVIGKYNKATVSGSGTEASPYTYTDVGDYPFIIGNGTGNSTSSRSNAFTVDWSGNVVASGSFTGTGATFNGDVIIGSTDSSGNVSGAGNFKIGAKNDNYGIMPWGNNWNQIGSSSLYWFRGYINHYYGQTSHVTNWDAGKNIGTAATASAAATRGSVYFYNTCAANGTQTKTLLDANSSATSNITITLPSSTGTLALTSSSITGNAATATKATQDSDGNTIKTTYAKLSGAAFTGALSGTSASFSSTLTATSTITGGSFSTTGSVSCASVTATGNVMAANTSHVGMIIMSTTLDTMAKVIAIYGGTTWIQHSGYMLRGATSGVTANSATSNGGAETVTLTVDQIPSHTHPNPSDGAFIINKSVTSGYAMAFGAGSYNRTSASATGSRGGGQAHENMPPYKNVYIWERTA